MFSLNEQHQRMITWMQKRLGHFQADEEKWEQQARSTQKIPSGAWRIWLILAGRGFGKTRTGSETIRQWIQSGVAKRVCLLGQNLPEVRRTMIEGESGLLSVHTDKNRPTYWPSQRKLVWPNGGQAFAFSADAYEQLRGPQFDAAWIDELAKFPHAQEAWDQMMLGLRLGSSPRIIVTTTPRPTRLIQTLLERDDVVVTRGSTWDNADHLPVSYLESLKTTYANTPLGQQEIEGKLIDSDSEALWSRTLVTQARGLFSQKPSSYWMCVVAIDPAVTSHEKSAETGIMVIGMTDDGLIHVIRDESCRTSPDMWMKKAVDLYHEMEADWLVAEMNHGGQLIESLLKTLDTRVRLQPVRAKQAKSHRALPIVSLYRQGKVIHHPGLETLENQLLTYRAGSALPSDRMDALVWGIHFLWEAYQKNQTGVYTWQDN